MNHEQFANKANAALKDGTTLSISHVEAFVTALENDLQLASLLYEHLQEVHKAKLQAQE